MSEDTLQRLQKVIAQAGVTSRRKAEEIILEGRVTVNGQVVTQLGTKVDPARDDVRVDGQRIQAVTRNVYIVLNKPKGVLSAMRDSRGRKTLGDLVMVPERLYPVGRLDATSEGLVLLTDDGELANRLTHPRYGHEKEYRVLVYGRPTEQTLDAWRRGVVLEGERTAPARVDLVRADKDQSLLDIVMREGRKRQIRDVASLLGHPVLQLQRVRLGPLHLGTLAPGQWRYLTAKEVKELTAIKGPGSKSRKPAKRSASTGSDQEAERRREPAGPDQEAERRREPVGSDQKPKRRRERPGSDQKAERRREPVGSAKKPSRRSESTGSGKRPAGRTGPTGIRQKRGPKGSK